MIVSRELGLGKCGGSGCSASSWWLVSETVQLESGNDVLQIRVNSVEVILEINKSVVDKLWVN
mgnify:CR=1 FL=1